MQCVRSTAANAFKKFTTTLRNDSARNWSRKLHTDSAESFKSLRENVRPAILSRAAAKAVRVSLQDGNKMTAFQVVSSLIYSTRFYSPGQTTVASKFSPKIAIDFGCAVSPRLSCHTLLHDAIRSGNASETRRISHEMLKLNLRVRSKSLERAVTMLCNASNSPSRTVAATVGKLSSSFKHPDAFTRLASNKFRTVELGYATEIFFAAKEYQRQRTKAMFMTLMNACMLQGEIVVFTFLLVFMLNQWHMKQQPSPVDSVLKEADLNMPDSHILNQFRWTGKEYSHWFPHGQDVTYEDAHLEDLIKAIHQILHEKSPSDNRLRQALQSLAILANLLDTGWLPTSEISKLVRLMRICPGDAFVWVFDGTSWERRNPKGYFDGVVQRYIQRALDHHRGRAMAHPPSRQTWNALLNHALCMHSTELVDQLSQRMVSNADGQAEPDIVAYNILLRGGTIFHRPEIVEWILQKLKTRPENRKRGVPFLPKNVERHMASYRPIHSSSVEAIKGRVVTEDGNDSALSNEPIIDDYTLSLYISHLTATGRPHLVAEMVFYLIPELCILEEDPGIGERRTDLVKQIRREKALARAVHYGPHFFATVIHALQKAGKTGLAERVLMLAKKAESVSWETRYYDSGVAEPWCLPIHAYTSMMQCYAEEAMKGLIVRTSSSDRRSRRDRGLLRRMNARVQGWGRLGFAMNTRTRAEKRIVAHQLLRREIAAHEMAVLLYKSMQTARAEVVDALVRAQHAINNGSTQVRLLREKLQVPQPDATFFNAALKVLGRRGNLNARRYNNRSKWKRWLRRASERYVKTGETPLSHSQPLVEILMAMRRAGYDVPLGFMPLLIGKEPGLIREAQRGPGGPRFNPFGIPARKTRALRRTRRRRTRRI